MRDYRRYFPAFVFLIGCGFIWNSRSQSAIHLAAPLSSVLNDLPGYRIQNQELPAEERRIAGMSDYVARVYWRDSMPAFTTFVSYYERQTQGKTIHSPRNCLPGAGWEVLTAGTAAITVDGVQHVVNRYTLKNGPSTAVAYYWYQGRGRVVANEYAVKWNLLKDAALAGHTEEALVRVVVPIPRGAGPVESANANRLLAEANALGADISVKLIRDLGRVLPQG